MGGFGVFVQYFVHDTLVSGHIFGLDLQRVGEVSFGAIGQYAAKCNGAELFGIEARNELLTQRFEPRVVDSGSHHKRYIDDVDHVVLCFKNRSKVRFYSEFLKFFAGFVFGESDFVDPGLDFECETGRRQSTYIHITK